MKIYVVLLAFALIPSAEKVKVWKEKKGLAVIEAEHIQIRNDLPLYWSSRKLADGYSGTGYLYWEGASFLTDSYDNLDEERILEYYVSIQKEGVYYLKLKGLCVDEFESFMLARINGSDWHKYTVQNEKTFSWDVNDKKGLCAAFLQMGYHKIEIAGISSGFMIDKLKLIHESELVERADQEPVDEVNESRSEYLSQDRFKGITN